MVERPDITDDIMVTALQQAYHVSAASVTFLPLGNDATASLFRIEAVDGATYLLKLKRGPVEEASLSVPYYLYRHGFAAAVAPLATMTGALTAPCDDFTLLLYPFIAGDTGMAVGLSPAQWRTFGLLLKQLHTTTLPATLFQQLPRESFLLYWHEIMQALAQQIHHLPPADPLARALAAVWQERHAEIWAIVERTVVLGQQLQAIPPPFVLCHADIHTANLLVDPGGGLHIVDWDGVILAPKERDLMFVTERATIQHPTEAAFFAGYGEAVINPVAFAYYRYEWVVQEMADYGRRIVLLDDLGETTRAEALEGFRTLFAPGDVVDVAYGAEADLLPRAR